MFNVVIPDPLLKVILGADGLTVIPVAGLGVAVNIIVPLVKPPVPVAETCDVVVPPAVQATGDCEFNVNPCCCTFP